MIEDTMETASQRLFTNIISHSKISTHHGEGQGSLIKERSTKVVVS